MTSLLSRRSLVAATAPAVFFAVSVPAVATELGPIEAMWPEHLRLEGIASAAASRCMDAEEHYEEPPRPIWHPFTSAGAHEIVPTTKGRGFVYVDVGEENIAYLRERAADLRDTDENGFACYEGERARNTLATIEAWQAEVARRKAAIGLDVAEAEERAAYAAANDYRTAMLAIEATTIRELAHQAALFDDDWRQLEGERLIGRLAELVGVVPHCQR